MTISANFPNVQPSLLLDFANAKQLPPQVTFTRATSATYYDGSTTAKAEQNFFYYSQDFSQAAWGVNGATKTSTTETDPAGGSTALLLTKVSDNGYSLRQYSNGPSPDSKVFTYTIYLKGASAGSVRLFIDNGVNQSSILDVSITTSWVRYTLTSGTFNSTTGYLTAGVGLLSGSVSSVYVAFAQIEERSSATAYTATTTQAITNYIPVLLTAGGGQPRFDHNPITSVSLGLAIESQRTNLCLQSADFTTTWSSANRVTITSNTIVAPDGTLTGDKLIANSGASNTHYVVQNTGSISAPWTFSCYAKAGEYSRIGFSYSNTGYVFFNLLTGVQEGTVGGGITSTIITAVGNGWYRISFTSTSTASGANIGIYLFDGAYSSGIPSFSGNDFNGVYIWGAQAESGSFPTSYIPTTSASATRAAETVTMSTADTAAILDINQGVMLVEATLPPTGGYDIGTFACGIGYSSTDYLGLLYAGTGYFQPTHGGFGPTPTAEVAGTLNKGALSWSGTSGTVPAAYAQNGQVSNTENGNGGLTCFAKFPNLTYLSIGFAAFDTALANRKQCWIGKVAVYPQAATSAQLQALTA